jgi:hypothetical protein
MPTPDELRAMSRMDREDALRNVALRGDPGSAGELARTVARINIDETGVPAGASFPAALLNETARLQAVTNIRGMQRDRTLRQIVADSPPDIVEQIRRLAEEEVEDNYLAQPQRRRATGRERQAELLQSQLGLLRRAQEMQRQRSIGGQTADRLAREDQYCRSLAADMFSATASVSQAAASAITGRGVYEQGYYRDCMRSFERVRLLTR